MSELIHSKFMTRKVLTTKEAAAFLGLKPQTLRCWACYQKGPVIPVRIGNRLRWRLVDLEELIDKEPY